VPSNAATAVVTTPLSEKEREQVQRFLSDPTVFPAIFRSWITSWVEANPPLIPISQITGFSQFLGNYDVTVASVNTASVTFVELTGGPDADDLADGVYVIMFGAQARTDTSGKTARMGVSVNGGAVDTDKEAASAVVVNEHSIMMALTATLDNGGANTLTVKYASSDAAATAFFRGRWFLALKIANI